jgi:hypothetical protein
MPTHSYPMLGSPFIDRVRQASTSNTRAVTLKDLRSLHPKINLLFDRALNFTI